MPIITNVDGSGTAEAEFTAMPMGPLNPVMSEAFTVLPEVVYSPTVPLPTFATNRFDPDIAMPSGKPNPVTSDAFTLPPEVVYSPTCRRMLVTKRFDPDTAMPKASIQSRDERGVHRATGGRVFANPALGIVRDKKIRPRYRDAVGEAFPVMSDAFTVEPEVVYSPIVPLPKFVTKRSDPDMAMPTGCLTL